MRFVRSVPEKGGASPVPIRIALMSQADAEFWHRHVQPDIVALGRTDANWDWRRMRQWLPVVEFARGRRAPAFVVLAQAEEKAAPVGMALLSEGYSALHDGSKRSVFVWFVAAAPEETMRRLGVSGIPKLLRALIDVGVTHSHNVGYRGCTGLHAAPEGKQDLFDRYVKIGLTPLLGIANVPGYLRFNDGRYFYLDEPDARKWSNALNPDR
ncbi:MAG: hypothetical protein WAO95_19180 [Burkholderiales bacterium]